MNKAQARTLIQQTRVLTYSSLKSRYRKTWAGFLWVVLNPIILFLVQSFIFESILNINLTRYSIYLATGLIPWFFINQSLSMGIPVLHSSHLILKAYQVDPKVLILAQLIENFIIFLSSFFIVLIPLMLLKSIPLFTILTLPLTLLPLFLAVTGLTFFLSTLQIFYRDTKFVMSFLMNILFFLTPIFYSIENTPSKLHFFFKVNPFYYLLEPFRHSIYHYNIELFQVSLIKSFICAIALIILAIFYWKRRRNEFYLHL